MKETIEKNILRECAKLIRRQQKHVRSQRRYQARFAKRTGLAAQKSDSYIPGYWGVDCHFDPFYVRSRADVIAHSIASEIRAETYKPKPNLILELDKPGGGTRQITVFTVPDSAVSHYLFRQLLQRNGQLFSSYSYAYRRDRNAHHAIEHLYGNVQGRKRQYVLEFDFSKYFDSISHKYLFDVLRRLFKVSPRERDLITQLLRSKSAQGVNDYQSETWQTRAHGVPQGTSISLFLANVACVELDREMEQQGAIFARYADDTVIICDSYEAANSCADLMLSHGARSETRVNFDKSDGISILTPDKSAELRCKELFDFLGYGLSQERVTLSQKAIGRIKKRLSSILYKHLLLYPRRGQFNAARVDENNVDWDMVTCINEIRRYLYGRIREETITKCLSDKSEPLVRTMCLLSYYPLVDEPQVFAALDGWLVDAVQRAQKERKRVLRKFRADYRTYSKAELISGEWYESEIFNETKLPSFFRAWQYIRKCLNVYGMHRFPNPPYSS
jgi:hypothetical protein